MFSHTSDSQPNSFNPSRILIGIFFTALAFRLWGVTNPLLDFHGWRQTLTASFAYNFYVNGMNFFNPSPSMINSIFHFEFPLYTYFIALLYKVFGFHEIIGRIVAIGFSMGSIWFLYLLGKRYFDEVSALVACGTPFQRLLFPHLHARVSHALFFHCDGVYVCSLARH